MKRSAFVLLVLLVWGQSAAGQSVRARTGRVEPFLSAAISVGGAMGYTRDVNRITAQTTVGDETWLGTLFGVKRIGPKATRLYTQNDGLPGARVGAIASDGKSVWCVVGVKTGNASALCVCAYDASRDRWTEKVRFPVPALRSRSSSTPRSQTRDNAAAHLCLLLTEPFAYMSPGFGENGKTAFYRINRATLQATPVALPISNGGQTLRITCLALSEKETPGKKSSARPVLVGTSQGLFGIDAQGVGSVVLPERAVCAVASGKNGVYAAVYEPVTYAAPFGFALAHITETGAVEIKVPSPTLTGLMSPAEKAMSERDGFVPVPVGVDCDVNGTVWVACRNERAFVSEAMQVLMSAVFCFPPGEVATRIPLSRFAAPSRPVLPQAIARVLALLPAVASTWEPVAVSPYADINFGPETPQFWVRACFPEWQSEEMKFGRVVKGSTVGSPKNAPDPSDPQTTWSAVDGITLVENRDREKSPARRFPLPESYIKRDPIVVQDDGAQYGGWTQTWIATLSVGPTAAWMEVQTRGIPTVRIARLNKDTGQWTVWEEVDGVPSDWQGTLTADTDAGGGAWLFTQNAAYTLNQTTNRWQTIPVPNLRARQHFKSGGTLAFTGDGTGTYCWVLMTGRASQTETSSISLRYDFLLTLRGYDLNTGEVHAVDVPSLPPSPDRFPYLALIDAQSERGVVWAEPGHVWVGSARGVLCYDVSKKEWQKLRVSPRLPTVKPVHIGRTANGALLVLGEASALVVNNAELVPVSSVPDPVQ